jgi:hypothetical protein
LHGSRAVSRSWGLRCIDQSTIDLKYSFQENPIGKTMPRPATFGDAGDSASKLQVIMSGLHGGR